MGDRRENIEKAVRMMENELALEVSEVSDLIETEPWGFEAQQPFLNAAMRFEIPEIGQNPNLCSHALLRFCKQIERQWGRAEAPLYDTGALCGQTARNGVGLIAQFLSGGHDPIPHGGADPVLPLCVEHTADGGLGDTGETGDVSGGGQSVTGRSKMFSF